LDDLEGEGTGISEREWGLFLGDSLSDEVEEGVEAVEFRDLEEGEDATFKLVVFKDSPKLLEDDFLADNIGRELLIGTLVIDWRGVARGEEVKSESFKGVEDDL
jgi:hypothetical protein